MVVLFSKVLGRMFNLIVRPPLMLIQLGGDGVGTLV